MFEFSSFLSNSYYIQNHSLPNGDFGLLIPFGMCLSADKTHYLICEFDTTQTYQYNIIEVGLDGENMQLLKTIDLSNVFLISDICITADATHYLYIRTSVFVGGINYVIQMDLDGTNETVLIDGNTLFLQDGVTNALDRAFAICLSADKNHYLIVNISGTIIQVNLDGTNPVIFMDSSVLLQDGVTPALQNPSGICISIDNNHYLIVNANANNIIQVNLDGTNPVIFIDSSVLLQDGVTPALQQPIGICLSKDSSYYLVSTFLNGIFKVKEYTKSIQRISMKSLFTDNSRVYYKPGSLAAGGVGTVRNSSIKLKRI